MADDVKENVEVVEAQQEAPQENSVTQDQPQQDPAIIQELKTSIKGISEQLSNQFAALATDVMEGIKNILNKENAKPAETKETKKDTWI